MQFDWSTFFLEIINFIVLVWLLAHFFYKPIRANIQKRRQTIEGELTKARETEQKARQMQKKYQQQLNHWQEEKAEKQRSLTQALTDEMESKRQQMLKKLSVEKQALQAQQQQQLQVLQKKQQQQAYQSAMQFCTKLLSQLADSHLEASIIDFFLKWLPDLPETKLTHMHQQLEDGKSAQITTAFPLSDEQRQHLQSALSETLKHSLALQFAQDPQLIAGICFSVGSLMLQVNIKNEFNDFVTVALHE